MTLLRCSFFTKAADNMPSRWEGTWRELRDRLEVTNTHRPGTIGDEAKKSLPAISGTLFKDGTRRASANALEMGLILFDWDNASEEATGEFWPDPRTGEPTRRPKLRKVMTSSPVAFDDLQEALWEAGVNSYSWSTWSHSPEWPKSRVLVPLAHPVPAGLWTPATEWAMDFLGFNPLRHGLDLPVLRDTARLNFLPGAPDPRSIRRGETVGTHLAIPIEELRIAEVPQPVVPQRIFGSCPTGHDLHEPGERWFQAYRVGGRPVDFRELDLASLLSSRGIAVGGAQAFGGATKWRCHCPYSHEHSGGVDDDCAVVIHAPGHWPTFKCLHSHHADLGLQDIIEFVWGRP